MISCHKDHASVPPKMSHRKSPASVQLRRHAYDAAAMFVVAYVPLFLSLSFCQDPRVNADRNAKLTLTSWLSRLLVIRPWKLRVTRNLEMLWSRWWKRIVALFGANLTATNGQPLFKRAYHVVLYREDDVISNDDVRRSPDYDIENSARRPRHMCLHTYVHASWIHLRDDNEES